VGSQEDLDVLNRKFLTCLTQAKYVTVEDKDPDEYQHYGLNFPIYTHFTSPIRRYADLLVHRLLTISLKEQEKTRDLIDGIDYASYAELCSEKSYNARKAGKDCQRLFHCLLLKNEGPRVYDCLIFDVDHQSISVYVQEINIHHNIKLKDESRVDSIMPFEDELKVACIFKEPLVLANGLQTYDQRKKKGEKAPESKELKDGGESLAKNVCFSVYDKVKLRVEATTEFPLDIKCTLLLTGEDLNQPDLLPQNFRGQESPISAIVQEIQESEV